MINRVTDAPLGEQSIRKYMMISGLGVAISIMTGYYSMSYLTLSEFTTLRCMDPFATALLCRIYLDERVTKTQIMCCGEVLSDPHGPIRC
jgi:drug/metabolite transporter (DMT)-like permease